MKTLQKNQVAEALIISIDADVADSAASESTLEDSFLSRELSQIAFNRRVLAQAEDSSLPLLERLRYLCIVSSNLDEFFEVRIASLLARDRVDGDDEHHELKKSLAGTSPECHALVRHQYSILNQQILPALAKKGIHELAGIQKKHV